MEGEKTGRKRVGREDEVEGRGRSSGREDMENRSRERWKAREIRGIKHRWAEDREIKGLERWGGGIKEERKKT